MKGVFVIGTDTGVGKTLVSAALMAAAPDDVVYWKPVQTGSDDDTATVRRLGELDRSRAIDEGVRLPVPASPHHAAALAGQPITLCPLLAVAERHRAPDRRWVVEGAGGLMVPLSEDVLLPELIRALGLPVLVVASTRLGTINHTLLTLSQCAREGLDVLGVVLSGAPDDSARTALAAHAAAPVLAELNLIDPVESATIRCLGAALLDTWPLSGLLGPMLAPRLLA